MNNASLNTVLTLDESTSQCEDEVIELVLTAQKGATGKLVGSFWCPDLNMHEVDIVDATFNANASSGAGNVQVKINLLSGQKFNSPYAYAVNEEGERIPMECIEVKPIKPNQKEKANAISLIFLEPSEPGEHYIYSNVIFTTTIGDIDPTIIVRRRRPD